MRSVLAAERFRSAMAGRRSLVGSRVRTSARSVIAARLAIEHSRGRAARAVSTAFSRRKLLSRVSGWPRRPPSGLLCAGDLSGAREAGGRALSRRRRLVRGVRVVAWHRRPESRAGPLMVVTGLLFFVHGTLGRLHSSFAETIGIAVSNYWIITFAALLVWFPGGRRRWAASEKFIIGAFVVAEVVLTLAWMLFAQIPRNLALVWPTRRSRPRSTERPARSGSRRRFAWRSFSLRAG